VLDKLAEDITANRSPRLGVFFGTHNSHSVDLVLEQLEAKGLAERTKDGKLRPADGIRGRVCIGQLYGKFSFSWGLMCSYHGSSCRTVDCPACSRHVG
jgi:hypothetical protein